MLLFIVYAGILRSTIITDCSLLLFRKWWKAYFKKSRTNRFQRMLSKNISYFNIIKTCKMKHSIRAQHLCSAHISCKYLLNVLEKYSIENVIKSSWKAHAYRGFSFQYNSTITMKILICKYLIILPALLQS